MVQKECNCKTCSGVLPELDQENTTEKTERETTSIYDQLNQIIYDANDYPDLTLKNVAPVLEEITSLINSLDDDIRELQNEVLSNPKELTQVKLGELSKKLY